MSSMFAVVSTDGQMTFNDLEKECVSGKWIPLCVLKNKKTGEIMLPVFNLKDICYRFIVRNIPKNWQKGCVELTAEDMQTINLKKWKLCLLDFPRKFEDHPEYEMVFEIHEFSEEPDFKVN